jgi:hypothetical protein
VSHTAYIVPTSLLSTIPSGIDWHATQPPDDPTQSLVVIDWENPNFQDVFEAQVGVLPLGHPWEPLPAEAVPVLASLQDPSAVAKGGAAIPTLPDPAAAPDTVATALRKTTWQGARLVR